MNKKGPELRFKDFIDDWIEVELGDITSDVMYGMNSAAIPFDGKNKYIRITDIDEISNKYIGLKPVSPDGVLENKFILRENDIVFARTGASVGKSYLYNSIDGKLYFAGFLIKFHILDNNNSLFVFYNTLRYSYKKWVKIMSVRSGQPGLNAEEYKSFSFYKPSIKEQIKIASFLYAIDSKIDLLSKKKDLMKQYKKGIMQKLFSQEIRFKNVNGGDYPDWKEKKLGELTKKVSVKNKENLSLPVYSINNKHGFIPQGEQFDGLDSDSRGYDLTLYKVIGKNTFAYNPARINVGSLGYSGELENVIISSLYVCFKTSQEIYDKFLLSWFDTFTFNKSVIRKTEGGVRDYLFYNNFANIKFSYPCIEEQQKISLFLLSIDSKISQLDKELSLAHVFKKGLLQKMFI